ncbi:MAG: hypothetical protein KDK66_05815 [Deltaproteobacteria bacterium]|nr:hypothetical protein [Deltaproteobacteria bacterium]
MSSFSSTAGEAGSFAPHGGNTSEQVVTHLGELPSLEDYQRSSGFSQQRRVASLIARDGYASGSGVPASVTVVTRLTPAYYAPEARDTWLDYITGNVGADSEFEFYRNNAQVLKLSAVDGSKTAGVGVEGLRVLNADLELGFYGFSGRGQTYVSPSGQWQSGVGLEIVINDQDELVFTEYQEDGSLEVTVFSPGDQHYESLCSLLGTEEGGVCRIPNTFSVDEFVELLDHAGAFDSSSSGSSDVLESAIITLDSGSLAPSLKGSRYEHAIQFGEENSFYIVIERRGDQTSTLTLIPREPATSENPNPEFVFDISHLNLSALGFDFPSLNDLRLSGSEAIVFKQDPKGNGFFELPWVEMKVGGVDKFEGQVKARGKINQGDDGKSYQVKASLKSVKLDSAQLGMISLASAEMDLTAFWPDHSFSTLYNNFVGAGLSLLFNGDTVPLGKQLSSLKSRPRVRGSVDFQGLDIAPLGLRLSGRAEVDLAFDSSGAIDWEKSSISLKNLKGFRGDQALEIGDSKLIVLPQEDGSLGFELVTRGIKAKFGENTLVTSMLKLSTVSPDGQAYDTSKIFVKTDSLKAVVKGQEVKVGEVSGEFEVGTNIQSESDRGIIRLANWQVGSLTTVYQGQEIQAESLGFGVGIYPDSLVDIDELSLGQLRLGDIALVKDINAEASLSSTQASLRLGTGTLKVPGLDLSFHDAGVAVVVNRGEDGSFVDKHGWVTSSQLSLIANTKGNSDSGLLQGPVGIHQESKIFGLNLARATRGFTRRVGVQGDLDLKFHTGYLFDKVKEDQAEYLKKNPGAKEAVSFGLEGRAKTNGKLFLVFDNGFLKEVTTGFKFFNVRAYPETTNPEITQDQHGNAIVAAQVRKNQIGKGLHDLSWEGLEGFYWQEVPDCPPELINEAGFCGYYEGRNILEAYIDPTGLFEIYNLELPVSFRGSPVELVHLDTEGGRSIQVTLDAKQGAFREEEYLALYLADQRQQAAEGIVPTPAPGIDYLLYKVWTDPSNPDPTSKTYNKDFINWYEEKEAKKAKEAEARAAATKQQGDANKQEPVPSEVSSAPSITTIGSQTGSESSP